MQELSRFRYTLLCYIFILLCSHLPGYFCFMMPIWGLRLINFPKVMKCCWPVGSGPVHIRCWTKVYLLYSRGQLTSVDLIVLISVWRIFFHEYVWMRNQITVCGYCIAFRKQLVEDLLLRKWVFELSFTVLLSWNLVYPAFILTLKIIIC